MAVQMDDDDDYVDLDTVENHHNEVRNYDGCEGQSQTHRAFLSSQNPLIPRDLLLIISLN